VRRPMPQLAEATGGFHPAEALLDQFPFLLTEGIATMARRPAINSAAAVSRGAVLGDMARAARRPHARDEVARVVRRVGGEGNRGAAQARLRSSPARHPGRRGLQPG
jgi:hypothetical protein